jgi:microcin C transport system ATP-binding protein
MALLEVDKLSLSFGNPRSAHGVVEAVKNVSFTVDKGEMLAVVGESGSGKSLSALACMGLQPSSAQVSGSIRFDGQEVLGTSEQRLRSLRGRRISMIFQEPMTALNPLHTVRQQIAEMLDIHQRLTRQQAQARILELLQQVGLAHMHDRLESYPHQLSGGERQRVMIAMAMANRPDLLIADEPTTAVDVTIQAHILKLLKELQKSMNMAMLFITHDLTIVRRLADRVAVMSQGQIVEQGLVHEVFERPAHPYTKHLLSSEPKGAPLPAAAGAAEVVSCETLKVHFPIKKGVFKRTVGHVKAVENISLSILEGTALGVVGESGSGKTTLGFALLRMLRSEGRIVFMGRDIRRLPGPELRALRQKMQVVFQDPFSSLNPRMTVRQIIEEGLLVHYPQKPLAERDQDIDTILADVGLSAAMKERYPHEFSGGQRQRISIARAMVLRPRFVVLDEPTSALDLSVQAQIIDLLKKLQQKYGLSYMFISHDLRVVRAIAHQLIVMRKGVIVEQGETAQVFAQPRHDYTRTLINAAFLEE